MIIHYKNKFRKVFGLSLLLSVIIVVYLLFLRQTIYSGNYNTIIINQEVYTIMTIIVFAAVGLYIWTHYLLAKAKGYSGWLTLLAIFNLLGLVILFLLPDKRKNG